MDKSIIIGLALLLIIASVAGFIFFVYNSPLLKTTIGDPGTVIVSPTGNIVEATGTFGVKIHESCLSELNDFIKSYGQDYSKCLTGFSFDNEYCGGFDPNTQGLSDENVIVILDASGSMAERIGSDTKINIAKKAVSDFLAKMPKSVNTGLIVYGHKGSNSPADKSLSCKGVEEVVKIGKNNSSNVIKAMNSFEPRGWTPIAGSLNFAENVFKGRGKEDKNYLILVSDGAESCDGDPLAAAQDLMSNIADVKLSVIGLATDEKTSTLLNQIAVIGGGSYLTAQNSSDIAKAFNEELLMIKKDCANVTLFELSLKYKANNLNNLNCWLEANQKENDSYDANLAKQSVRTGCNTEISDVLIARQKDLWYKKQTLEEKNSAVYDKIEAELNDQLQALNNTN